MSGTAIRKAPRRRCLQCYVEFQPDTPWTKICSDRCREARNEVRRYGSHDGGAVVDWPAVLRSMGKQDPHLARKMADAVAAYRAARSAR